MNTETKPDNFDRYNFLGFALVEAQAFKFGDDLWTKSGRHTPYFFNAGQFRTGKTLSFLGKAYAHKLNELYGGKFGLDGVVLFGPAYKGIGLVHVTAVALADLYDINVSVTYNRKEEKDHGEGGIFVGEKLKGKRVIIIEDVITDGATKEEAVSLIRSAGGDVIGCIIAFDRQECGKDSKHSASQEFLERTGVPIRAVAALSDLITVMDTPGAPAIWSETVQKIKNYRAQYGA